MNIAGMMRLSEIDQTKLGKEIMMFSIKEMSLYCNHMYFLNIGNVDSDIIQFIKSLNKPYDIFYSKVDYGQGWYFKNTESLDDLYKSIDKTYDWIIYPDADDILPENILEIIQQANDNGSDVIRLHFIEAFKKIDQIIEITPEFPIGPHFKAFKPAKDITFIGSDGFNEPTTNSGRLLKRFESDYCVRHLRYANKNLVKERMKMNYFEYYFLQDHKLIPYKPMQKKKYYEKS